LIVTESAQFENTASIGSGAVLTIASTVYPPTAAPTLSYTYPSVTITGLPGQEIKGIAKGHNNNIFVLSYKYYTQTMYLSEHDPLTGKFIANRYTFTPLVPNGSKVDFGDGLVFRNGMYYFHYSLYSAFTGIHTYYVVTLSSVSFTPIGTVTVFSTFTTLANTAVGWDYTNGRLMFSYTTLNSSTNSGNNQTAIRTYSINADGQPASGSFTTQPVSTGFLAPNVAFLARGPFGVGDADRIVIKSKTYSISYYQTNYIQMATTGNIVLAESWKSANTSNINGAYYDDTTKDFYDVSAGGKRRQYRSGDSFTSGNNTVWVGYSWATADGNLETTLSPTESIQLPNRATLSVTIPAIPTGLGRTNDPRVANVWTASSVYAPPPTGSIWKKRQAITYPASSTLINPYQTVGAVTPKTTNTFASQLGGHGSIRTTSGKSYWNGDDTAQFYGLIIWGGLDVDFNAGNKPPLRIRDAGNTTEMRLDGNELATVRMVSLDAQGNTLSVVPDTMALQREAGDLVIGQTGGSGTFYVRKPMEVTRLAKFGADGRGFTQRRHGTITRTTDSSGRTTITHGGSTAPDTVLVTSQGDGLDGWCQVAAIGSTTFDILLRGGSTNSLLATTKTFHWEAIWN
jgi:hypothetical protein